VYVIGDIALAIAEWAIKGTAADGSDVDLQGRTADVLRKGHDGWKFAIDNPFGTA
jgi:ketosteroid isomerase-like protein